MFHTLRRRLVLSHILPLLVVVPMVGIALIYVLETQVMVPYLAKELEENARLLASFLIEDPEIWRDTARAQMSLARIDLGSTVRATLLDAGGHVLASTDAADADRVGQRLKGLDLDRALVGEVMVRTAYTPQLRTETADVMVPVMGAEQNVLGIVRLSHQPDAIQDWFGRLRILVFGVLAVGLALGAAVGIVLAAGLGRPIQGVT